MPKHENACVFFPRIISKSILKTVNIYKRITFRQPFSFCSSKRKSQKAQTRAAGAGEWGVRKLENERTRMGFIARIQSRRAPPQPANMPAWFLEQEYRCHDAQCHVLPYYRTDCGIKLRQTAFQMYEVSIFNILIENQGVLLLEKKKANPLDMSLCHLYFYSLSQKSSLIIKFTSSRKQGGGSY